MTVMHHLDFDDSHGARYALLPGDPGRVEKIAAHLENPRFYKQKREYTTWLGELAGETVMVISTGMGGPSTAICVEELHMTGVDTLIRIGTCGGMDLNVMPGDLIVATGAIRMEGTTREYVPIEFPAIANIDVVNAMVKASKDLDIPYHTGIVHCKDSYYGQHNPNRMPIGYELANKWEAWKKAGCLGSEMESASLFIVAQFLGMRAGCVLTVAANQERALAGLSNDRTFDTSKGIAVAIETVKNLITAEKEIK